MKHTSYATRHRAKLPEFEQEHKVLLHELGRLGLGRNLRATRPTPLHTYTITQQSFLTKFWSTERTRHRGRSRQPLLRRQGVLHTAGGVVAEVLEVHAASVAGQKEGVLPAAVAAAVAAVAKERHVARPLEPHEETFCLRGGVVGFGHCKVERTKTVQNCLLRRACVMGSSRF